MNNPVPKERVLHLSLTTLRNGEKQPIVFYNKPLDNYPEADHDAPDLAAEFRRALESEPIENRGRAIVNLARLALEHKADPKVILHSFKVAQGLLLSDRDDPIITAVAEAQAPVDNSWPEEGY